MKMKSPSSVTTPGAPPPTLTRRRLAARIRRARPEFPPELILIAVREIIKYLAAAWAAERTVALRRFGRFQVRRYHRSTKKLGLIFRPSPELTARVNPPLTEQSHEKE